MPAAGEEMHQSYLRIRKMLTEAGFDAHKTKAGGEDRFEVTEAALALLIEARDLLQNSIVRNAAIRLLDADVFFAGRRRRFTCPFCACETYEGEGGSGSAPLMELAHADDCALRLLKQAIEESEP